jgi:hypothetical protein
MAIQKRKSCWLWIASSLQRMFDAVNGGDYGADNLWERLKASNQFYSND